MSEHPWHDRLVALGLLAVLLVVGGMSFDRAARGKFDFHHFYLDARYVWEHGELNPNFDDPVLDQRRQLPFYLPIVPLALAPLTAFGRPWAALAWSVGQVAALGFSLYVLWRWCTDQSNGKRAKVAFALSILLAMPAFLEAGKFNQMSYFVLALVLGAMAALDRDRPRAAGALLGAATVLKVLPGIFLLWLVLKRRWWATASFGIAALVVGLVPPLAVFGPQKTVEYHRQWWAYNVQGEAASGLLNAGLPVHFIDRRNQSIAQVLARLTWPEHPYAVARQPVQLDPRTCAWLAYGITGVLLLALVWTTRRPWQKLSPERRHAEAAVYAIGMLVFSPLLRQYYLVWTVPALVLLARMALGGAEGAVGGDGPCPRYGPARATRETVPTVRWLARVGLGVWAVGMLAWAWPATRVIGTHLAMLIVIGILLLWATHTPSRESGVGAVRRPRGADATRAASE